MPGALQVWIASIRRFESLWRRSPRKMCELSDRRDNFAQLFLCPDVLAYQIPLYGAGHGGNSQ
jgi:hypothetical protein